MFLISDYIFLANDLADEDPEFFVKARNAFSALENGDEDNLDMCRVLTIKELQNELFAHQGICRVLQIVSKLTVPRGYVVFYKLLANSPLLLL